MKNSRRSSLFLIELMISILFFSLCATVCMQFFAKSRLISDNSTTLEHAILQAQSAAEAFESGNGTMDDLKSAFPMGIASDDTFEIYYNNEWAECSADEGSYILKLLITDENTYSGLISADITVSSKGSDLPVYQLHSDYHQPTEVSDYE